MRVYAFDLMPCCPVRGQTIYAEHLDQMVLCEECGFDAVCINEHHGAVQFGSLPHGLACKNIQMFAERALPELKRP